jgi:hypothetical protein
LSNVEPFSQVLTTAVAGADSAGKGFSELATVELSPR